jgi:hypothetical protein
VSSAGGLRLARGVAVGDSAREGVQRWSAVRVDARAVGHQFTGVFEQDYAVAEKAPALLRKRRHHLRGIVVDRVRWGAGGLVLAHCLSVPILDRGVAPRGQGDLCGVGHMNSDARYQAERLKNEQLFATEGKNQLFGGAQ